MSGVTVIPSGMPSGTLFSTRSRLWVSFSVSFALPGRVEAENWSPRGPKGVSGGPRKSSQIDSKSLSIPIGGLRRAGGYLPRCLQDTQGTYLCIFMHVFIRMHAYSCIFMHVLMPIHAYLCIFHACFMHMYAYPYIFIHIYVYSCICLIQRKYVYS